MASMDALRVGRSLRALRIRVGKRQQDVGEAAGIRAIARGQGRGRPARGRPGRNGRRDRRGPRRIGRRERSVAWRRARPPARRGAREPGRAGRRASPAEGAGRRRSKCRCHRRTRLRRRRGATPGSGRCADRRGEIRCARCGWHASRPGPEGSAWPRDREAARLAVRVGVPVACDRRLLDDETARGGAGATSDGLPRAWLERAAMASIPDRHAGRSLVSPIRHRRWHKTRPDGRPAGQKANSAQSPPKGHPPWHLGGSRHVTLDSATRSDVWDKRGAQRRRVTARLSRGLLDV